MNIKGLAERIILQSLEDLWDEDEKNDCINFFEGEGFAVCGELAGMNVYEMVKLYSLADKIIESRASDRTGRKTGGGKEIFTPEMVSLWNEKLLAGATA